MNSSVILINPYYSLQTIPPLGLGYIASVLRGSDIDVHILDFNAVRYSKKKVKGGDFKI